MTDKKQSTFRESLDKFIHIGNAYYNGKHHDNVMNIFNDLDEEDRMVFLRGVFHIYNFMEYGIHSKEMTQQRQVNPKTDEDDDIVVFNNRQMVELKVWFVKVLVWLVVFGLVILFGVGVYFSSTPSGEENGTSIFRVLATLFSVFSSSK